MRECCSCSKPFTSFHNNTFGERHNILPPGAREKTEVPQGRTNLVLCIPTQNNLVLFRSKKHVYLVTRTTLEHLHPPRIPYPPFLLPIPPHYVGYCDCEEEQTRTRSPKLGSSSRIPLPSLRNQPRCILQTRISFRHAAMQTQKHVPSSWTEPGRNRE